jgi:hypothetical protein
MSMLSMHVLIREITLTSSRHDGHFSQKSQFMERNSGCVPLCPTNNALQINVRKRIQKCWDAGYCARILIRGTLETFGEHTASIFRVEE